MTLLPTGTPWEAFRSEGMASPQAAPLSTGQLAIPSQRSACRLTFQSFLLCHSLSGPVESQPRAYDGSFSFFATREFVNAVLCLSLKMPVTLRLEVGGEELRSSLAQTFALRLYGGEASRAQELPWMAGRRGAGGSLTWFYLLHGIVKKQNHLTARPQRQFEGPQM